MSIELKHFKPHEFACKCGCGKGLEDMDIRLLATIDAIRTQYGKPIRINSAARCLEHNRSVGSKDTSEHVATDRICTGIDISCTNSTDRMALIKLAIAAGLPRIGIAKTFIHLGTSKTHAQNVLWLY